MVVITAQYTWLESSVEPELEVEGEVWSVGGVETEKRLTLTFFSPVPFSPSSAGLQSAW